MAKKDIERLEGRIEPKTKRSYEDQARAAVINASRLHQVLLQYGVIPSSKNLRRAFQSLCTCTFRQYSIDLLFVEEEGEEIPRSMPKN